MSTPTNIRDARKQKTKRSYIDAVLSAFDSLVSCGASGEQKVDQAKRRELIDKKAEVRRNARKSF